MGLLDDDVLLNTYPFNLLAAINSAITTPNTPKIALDNLPRDIYISVKYILQTLTHEEERTIILHFRDELSTGEIGKQMCIKPKQVSQMLRAALVKMAQPHFIRYLRDGLNTCTEQDIIAAAAAQRANDKEAILTFLDSLKALLQNNSNDSFFNLLDMESVRCIRLGTAPRQSTAFAVWWPDSAKDLQGMPLTSLGLPVRIINSLEHAGIHTVGDLLARRPYELLKIRGIGVNLYKKIVDSLKTIGIDTSMY